MAVEAGRLYGRWYYDTYSVAYEESEHWTAFFARAADAIERQLAPRTVLDVGCAKGFLVAALRDCGIDASGFDISEVAIAEAPEAVRPHVRVGSLVEPIEGRFDLVTCIEVVEHLDPADASATVANLCAVSDRVLFSSTPGHRAEATHVNVQPPERWSQLFAAYGFFRDFHHDAAYLSPWAALYERKANSIADVVVDYDRAWSQLRDETIEQRRALLDLQDRFEAIASGNDHELRGDNGRLREEILRLRHRGIGMNVELATALGRQAELEALVDSHERLRQHHEAVLNSRSWRVMWLIGTPLRKLRERRS